jgi:hypothetical protein
VKGDWIINHSPLVQADHDSNQLELVPQTGLEPVTPSLRMTCSTN